MSLKIKEVLKSIDEQRQKIAVKKALTGFLRTRYLSRDGLEPQSVITYDRSTVTEDVILEILSEMERTIEKEEQALAATLEETVNG